MSPRDDRLRALEERLYRLEHIGKRGAPRMRDLADVDARKATDGQGLVYDYPSGRWIAVDPPTLSGGGHRFAYLTGGYGDLPYNASVRATLMGFASEFRAGLGHIIAPDQNTFGLVDGVYLCSILTRWVGYTAVAGDTSAPYTHVAMLDEYGGGVPGEPFLSVAHKPYVHSASMTTTIVTGGNTFAIHLLGNAATKGTRTLNYLNVSLLRLGDASFAT